MSVPGVDFAWTKPTVKALKTAGEVFVVRYFSQDPTKNLTPAEAAAYEAASIRFCANWEYAATAMLGGRAQGVLDAGQAQTEADACGVPSIPVYFSCDFDAAPGDQKAINAYLDGAASVLGADRVGMYGGYWPVSRARAAGKTRYTWGTFAWSGTQWATADWKPDIMQGAFVVIGGVTCDLDAASSTDYGQWPRPAGPVKTWGPWVTKGRTSLGQVGSSVGMSPAHILRATAHHNHDHWDQVTFGWLNGVFGGQVAWDAPIPAGATLWVLRP